MFQACINKEISKASVGRDCSRIDPCDGNGEVIHFPTVLESNREFLLCLLLELWDVVLVPGLVDVDVKQHWRRSAPVATAAVVIESIHEVDHCFHCSWIVFFESDSIVCYFLDGHTVSCGFPSPPLYIA